MPKRSARPGRAVRWKPRAALKDDKGIPLTSDRRPFTILPSDFALAVTGPASLQEPEERSTRATGNRIRRGSTVCGPGDARRASRDVPR
jgi:hypothetical protein